MDNNNNINNPVFLNRLRKGDNSAYETLFLLYFDKLLHFSKSFITNPDDAKDIIQNTFFKLWAHREQLPTKINLNNYIFMMVKNECLDYLKHQKVKLNYKTDLEKDKTFINISSLSDNPNLLLIEKELSNKINLLIDDLPPRCKVVFIKSRVEGLKHKEIAEELNISYKTVENQITTALKIFRRELQEYMGLFF